MRINDACMRILARFESLEGDDSQKGVTMP